MDAALTRLTPPLTRVFGRQVLVLASPGTITSLVVALIGVQLLATSGVLPGTDSSMVPPVFAAYPFLIMMGAMWPAIVWHGEGPSRRLYHWSLPVRQDYHDLLRVAAGGLWLVAGLAALLAVAVAIDVGAGVGSRLSGFSLGTWVNYFTGPLTVYLLVSALAIATEHPLRWLLAWIVGTAFLARTCESGADCSIGLLSGFFGRVHVLVPYIGPEVFQARWAPGSVAPFTAMLVGLVAGVAAVVVAARARAVRPGRGA